MELLHTEPIERNKNHHSIVLKSQIINKKEKEETISEELIEEEGKHNAIVHNSKIIERKKRDDEGEEQ